MENNVTISSSAKCTSWQIKDHVILVLFLAVWICSGYVGIILPLLWGAGWIYFFAPFFPLIYLFLFVHFSFLRSCICKVDIPFTREKSQLLSHKGGSLPYPRFLQGQHTPCLLFSKETRDFAGNPHG